MKIGQRQQYNFVKLLKKKEEGKKKSGASVDAPLKTVNAE